MRVILLANTAWYLSNFRYDLACALREGGAEVHCIAPHSAYLDRLAGQGFAMHALSMGNQSFSPLDNYRTLRHLRALYREIRPDLAHHFTPRCVVLGSMAARSAGVPAVVNALTGLGHMFTSDSLKARVVRPVLRGVLRRYLGRCEVAAEAAPTGASRSIVVFQNRNDLDELVGAGIVPRERCRLIRGSGVDVDRFRPNPAPREDGEVRVLFASRLIAEKGINELVAAMQRVVVEHPNAMLWLAGETYAQNPTSLTEADLRVLDAVPWVKRFGHVDDVERLLSQVDIVALPSYREGTPKILIEAASCGLPIVATDIAGCRGVVAEGVNGYLVPVRAVDELAAALARLCADADSRRAMGAKGRQIVLDGFSSEIVVRETLKVYAEVLG